MDHEELTGRIIGCAMQVHRVLGPGFLASVYQKALAHEMRKAGLEVDCEFAIHVRYDGVDMGKFSADMLVGKCIIVENKAVQSISVTHEVQLVHYLTATHLDVGLLINFGAPSLQFKRKARTRRPRASPRSPADKKVSINPDALHQTPDHPVESRPRPSCI